jgi:UrcA family protein
MNRCNFALAIIAMLPLQANAQDVSREVHVTYRDLDLATPAGRETLDRRLASAIKAVCPDATGSVDVGFKYEVRRCLKVARIQASAKRDRVLAAKDAGKDGTMVLTDRGR